MKTEGRRVSKNISVVDPKTNAQDRADYKREQDDKKAITKMVLEDRASTSPYLTDKTPLKRQTPGVIDNAIQSMKNRYPEEKSMRFKNMREGTPPQKLKKSQVTPGKWKIKEMNTWSVE